MKTRPKKSSRRIDYFIDRALADLEGGCYLTGGREEAIKILRKLKDYLKRTKLPK